MRRLVGLGYVACVAIMAAAGCGGAGSGGEAECVDGACPCSEGGIRAAIAEGMGPYTFDCDGPTTVRTGREIVIENDVTLDGGGALTVDGNQRHRVFFVSRGVTAQLIDLTVANGRRDEENGGGIRNEGTLTLTRTTVSASSTGRDSGCATDDPGLLCSEGGGIWSDGTLTLVESAVSDSSAHFGGGIANRGGVLTLIDSSVRTSRAEGCRVGAVVCSGGGGIWNSGTLSMSNSTVSENDADWGGGIYNRGAHTLTESTVSRNSAGFDGGGLLNFETLLVIDSSVAGNVAGQSGGAIANNQGGVVEVTRSTLSSNAAAAAGGAVINQAGAEVALLNSTVSGNMAERGGGIWSGGALSLASSTMVANDAPSGSAIFDPGNPTSGPRSIRSTLIEGDCAGSALSSEGYNVESPSDTCGFGQETDLPGEAELGLGPLQDNGGPTRTHAISAGSVAADRVPEDACVDFGGEPLRADQRGEPRPAGASSACDVGAYEAQP